MAAGAGRRMGHRPKALLRRGGQSLIARQIGLLRGAGIQRVVVVLGHHAPRVAAELQALQSSDGLTWVINPDPDAGPGSSLRAGLAALPTDVESVMVLLADQPLLEPQDLAAVMRAWRARAPGIELVLPQCQGQPGHPLVFGPPVRRAVMQQAADGMGVRDWRRANPDRVQPLVVDHPRYTRDVDTPEDLAALQEEFGVRLEWPAA